MYHMVIFVINNPDECSDILDAWEAAGITGITILDSTGLGRLRGYSLRDDLPLMPSIHDLFRGQEASHRTIFSVVDSEEKVDAIVSATQKVIGDLDESHTGFLFVVPVSRVYGINKPHSTENE